jgi:hypothetical protein
MAEKHDFIKSVMLVVLGALIGLGPALYMAHTQANLQRHQLIFNQRITALREYTKAVHEFFNEAINGYEDSR